MSILSCVKNVQLPTCNRNCKSDSETEICEDLEIKVTCVGSPEIFLGKLEEVETSGCDCVGDEFRESRVVLGERQRCDQGNMYHSPCPVVKAPSGYRIKLHKLFSNVSVCQSQFAKYLIRKNPGTERLKLFPS